MPANTDRDARLTVAVLLIVVILLVSSIGVAIGIGAATTASASETREIDADHGLATDSAAETYAEQGYVSTTMPTLDMRVTVAESHDRVGLSGFQHTDIDTHWLRIQYNESIDRTIRFYIPSEMWHPQPVDGLEAAETPGEAIDMRPVNDGAYTAVTIDLDGETDAVFPVSKEASLVFQVRDTARSRIENVTGITLPSLTGGSGDWESLPDTALSGDNATATLEKNGADNVVLQYDVSGNNTTTAKWISIPACSDSDTAAVCRFNRGDESQIDILSRTSDPPPVRFKHGSDLMAGLRATVNEVTQIPDRIVDRFPSGSSLKFW